MLFRIYTLLFFVSSLQAAEEKLVIVITASYNNKDVCIKNLSSVYSQEYDHWKMIYIDDCSTDGTADLVESFLHQHKLEDRITFIRNTTRKGSLSNQYYAIHSCPKDAIILILDGDDWLAAPWAFAYINEIYQTKDVWLTYGQFIYSSTHYKGFCLPIPHDLWLKTPIRTLSWVASHPRTFYAGLFQKIALKDLLYEDDFFQLAQILLPCFLCWKWLGPIMFSISIQFYTYTTITTHLIDAMNCYRPS